jgi:hypothetical protein
MSDATRKSPLDAAESKTLGMCGNSLHGNRETLETPSPGTTRGVVGEGRFEKASSRTSDVYVPRESDGPIIPKKRAWIPKADGRQRPLGIAALEDKIVQQAVKTVLEPIYEEDFLGFSYGFRPGRSAHNALDALWVGIAHRKVNWVLDADIRGFFDTMCSSITSSICGRISGGSVTHADR